MRANTMIAALVVAFAAAACSQMDGLKGKSDKKSTKKGADATTTSTATGTSTATSTTTKTKPKGTGTGAQQGGETDGELPDLDSQDGGGGGGEADIQALLDDCGGAGYIGAAPDKVLYEKELESLPIVKNILLVTVTAKSSLKLKVTPTKQTQTSAVEIVKIDGIAKDLAKGMADQQAKDNSGTVTIDNVPPSEYANLGSKYKPYDGVVCTFVPATGLTNERGGKKTVVTFDPPLPMSVSPRANGKRYEAEIGDGRSFNVTATIKETDQQALQGKKTVKGKVTVEKIEPETEVDDGAGGKKSIKADIAFKMTFSFSDPKTTYLLGMAPEVSYYISYEKKDLVANIVNTEGGDSGSAVFIHGD